MSEGMCGRNYWPLGVTVALVLFSGGLVFLIYFALSSNSDLVVRDYYEQDVRYEQQIDRLSRTQSLAAEVEVSHEAALGKILIRLPADHVARGAVGEVHLYRPSAEGLDRRLPLSLNAVGMQVVEADGMVAGLWRVKILWTVEGQEYYVDRRLVIASGPA